MSVSSMSVSSMSVSSMFVPKMPVSKASVFCSVFFPCLGVLALVSSGAVFAKQSVDTKRESVDTKRGAADLLESELAIEPRGPENPLGKEDVGSWKDTLAQAYMYNLDFKGAQVELKGSEDKRKEALAEWVPSIDVVGSQTNGEQRRSEAITKEKTRRGGVQVRQSLFSSFGSVQRLKGSNREIEAKQKNLIAAENKVLFEALQAYLQVLVCQESVLYYTNDETKSKQILEQTRARFGVGEVTLTDVMTQEAQLAESVARRLQGEGDLLSARANYKTVVGGEPASLLIWPEDLPLDVPETLEELMRLSQTESPEVAMAFHQEEAERYQVNAEMANQFGPRVEVQAKAERVLNHQRDKLVVTDGYLGRKGGETDKSVSLSLTIPIATGFGQARVRGREHQLTRASLMRKKAQLTMRESLVKAWDKMLVTRQQINQFNLEMLAMKQAFEGVREEYSLGSKTIVDVGVIQKKLLESQVKLLEAKKSFILAKATIVSIRGRLLTENLHLRVQKYDPEAYNPWFRIGYDEQPPPDASTGG